MSKMSSAMMVTEHLINNDLTREELSDLAVRILGNVPDEALMSELKSRGYTRVLIVKDAEQ